MKVQFLLLSTLAVANAFTTPAVNQALVGQGASFRQVDVLMASENDGESSITESSIPAATAATAAMWALTSTSAMAAGPDWGIFEGRTLSLLHPAMMFGMLAFSVSTALLGFEWRRQRTIGDDISALKSTYPDLGGASTAAAALEAAQAAETPDGALISKLQAAVPIDAEIKTLQDERKELAAKGPRDVHFSQGATLAFIGTVFAIEGPLNTYARAGKLFPGPHLYAGAGLVCLWALAAACVPAMQKGNDAARYAHIGANLAGIGLFAWQVVSGVPILFKVIEFTKWP
mmetsp:Transcript_40371/g.97477  ORF Transcript_40371/g.97477 Transcript_40371/m.97477 type:complete len:288 (+) Transcript_40371:85-948(+)|eukprot:CAMPEP_0113630460 /NCGR_PEP_ID=MMETSP0017_2-20120614/15824_1 /TAXON_ID=2856 /ORGANISM="Cylindrotheca closterium" /LENGTH=287 /DNA_ID=CAMNT_0000540921 /DNA_START=28 /DNA_END=891 /DNA_ORIENTATION=+ /assembly_acc=CAM_ASM_000147